jgi:hypothetical protein
VSKKGSSQYHREKPNAIARRVDLISDFRPQGEQHHDRVQDVSHPRRAEPVPETLLGRTNQWCVTGSIFFIRANQSVIEVTRFRLSSVKFEDERVASWFGLELARLVIDSCYRELPSSEMRRKDEGS